MLGECAVKVRSTSLAVTAITTLLQRLPPLPRCELRIHDGAGQHQLCVLISRVRPLTLAPGPPMSKVLTPLLFKYHYLGLF